jgi:peroxiredoxin Q/BCP
LADYAPLYGEFKRAGAEVVAISVDPPERSAPMRTDLQLPFPILCDSSRKVITEWGLLNAREKGGIAIPATILIDRGGVVRLREGEELASRIPPAKMLEYVRALAKGASSAPARARVNPGLMFLRAIANGFRHGARVKRE